MEVMEGKCVDPSVQLEIDEMILDYLMFTATERVLDEHENRWKIDEYGPGRCGTDVLVKLVDCQWKMDIMQCAS